MKDISGLWTSGDVLLRLESVADQDKARMFYTSPTTVTFGKMYERQVAKAELIETSLENDVEILDRKYRSVLPKRDFQIRIGKAGWTWTDDQAKVVSALRLVEAEIIDPDVIEQEGIV